MSTASGAAEKAVPGEEWPQLPAQPIEYPRAATVTSPVANGSSQEPAVLPPEAVEEQLLNIWLEKLQ